MSNTVNIKIKESDERFPLLLQYEGQAMPQPCGFELSLETGELTAFVSRAK